MYAVLMTALVTADVQTQACLFRNRASCTRSGCFCSGYTSCGCCTPVVSTCCHSCCGGYVSSGWSCGCFSGCHSYVGCCSMAVPMPVACGCSAPVYSTGVVPFQPDSVSVTVPVQVQPMPQAVQNVGGLAGASADPTVTPSSDAEREAVRKALKSVRDKKSFPSDPTSPPPVNNPKLDIPPPPGLSAQAKLMIRVPENAKLWVDDVACPLEGELRTFTTPALQPGLEYSYSVRIAVERDGKMTTSERQVPFAAGKTVEVDFNTNATSVVLR